MNEKIQAYIAQKQQEEAAKEQARREKIMRAAGLTHKIYSPHEQSSQEFPEYDYEQMRYYKEVCEEVSDEELALLEKYAQAEEEEDLEAGTMFSNIGGKIKGVAYTAFWVGAVVSILAGFLLLAAGDEMILVGLLVAGVGCLGSWLGSLFLYGFGELIAKTVQIEKNTRK